MISYLMFLICYWFDILPIQKQQQQQQQLSNNPFDAARLLRWTDSCSEYRRANLGCILVDAARILILRPGDTAWTIVFRGDLDLATDLCEIRRILCCAYPQGTELRILPKHAAHNRSDDPAEWRQSEWVCRCTAWKTEIRSYG